ncbi:hypothetical protein ACH5RR_009204 [Cinchona calisaya]|uniref:Uncharacterized protein n=1 Tax=Cinchona calisaya TaxID=153742 RepID=A0ABD3AGK1_9GENT
MSSSYSGGGWRQDSSGWRQDGGEWRQDVRYQHKFCEWNRKEVVKIVESDKPSKGLLYFVCERRKCKFWAWCIPLMVDSGEEARGMTANNATNGLFFAMVESLEIRLKMMNTMMYFVLVVSVLSLLVASLK